MNNRNRNKNKDKKHVGVGAPEVAGRFCAAAVAAKRLGGALVGAFLLGLLAANPVLAQQAGDEPGGNAIEEVLVLGTSIRGTPIDSPFAVSVVTREEMEARGSPNLQDFFKNLGASHGVVGERASSFNSGQINTVDASVANVNLRGLGASRTLVLINGRRHTYLPARLIGGRFVDINSIPLTAVERVEVLKEGAAAVYGSDAIGGVVQFQTRRDFEGLEFSASHEAVEGAGADKLGVIAGGDVGRVHLTATFEHERYDALAERDRAYTIADFAPGQRGGWSSFGNPGAFWVRDAETGERTSILVDPQCDDFGGIDAGTVCRYRYQSFFNLVEETEYNRFFSELHYDSDNGTHYQLELLYADASSPNVLTSPAYPFVTLLPTEVLQVAPDHPGRVALCEDFGAGIEQCGANDPWYLRGRTIGNGGPAASIDRKSDTLRVAGGIEGMFELGGGDYDYSLGLAWSEQNHKNADTGSYTERLFLAFRGYGGPDCGVGVIAEPFSNAKMRLDPADLSGRGPGQGPCLYYNPFGNALERSAQLGAPFETMSNPAYRPELANDPALMDWISNQLELYSEAELLVLDTKLTREWIPGRLSSAAGYQYRGFSAAATPADEANFQVHPCQVRFDTSCIERDRFGPYAFTTTWDPYDSSQTVHRVFAEVALSLDRFDVQVAANYESYEESSSFDPMISIDWRVLPALTLRGTAQTTFRTPTVDELNPNKLTTLEFVRQTGTYIPIDRLGSPSLEPESAFTWNLGAVVFPDGPVQMTVDWWRYDFEKVINAAPHQSLVDLYGTPEQRDLVARYMVCPEGRAAQLIASGVTPCAPSGLARVEIPLVNWPGIQTSGIDVYVGGSVPLGPGVFFPRLDLSYVIDYEIEALTEGGVELESSRDAVGRVNFGHPLAPSIPRLKTQLSGAYAWSDYTLSAHLGYISSYDDRTANTTWPQIEDFPTLDLSLQWDTPIDGLRMAFSAIHLTDQEAPRANLEQGYDGFTHSAKGRRLKIAMTWAL